MLLPSSPHSALFSSDFTFMKLYEIVPYKFNEVSMLFIDCGTNSLIALDY